MRIDGVRIQAFRGVKDTLSLHFPAPVTVLFAPNGTGKSTVLDAVEWAVLGSLQRFDPKKLSLDTIRSKGVVDPSIPTSVELLWRPAGDDAVQGLRRAQRPTEKSSLQRTHQQWQGGRLALLPSDDGANGRWVNQAQPALLRTIRQSPDSGPRLNTAALSQWVRASHFLDGEVLTAILDRTGDRAGVRDDLFAGLLSLEDIKVAQGALDGVWRQAPIQAAGWVTRDLQAAQDRLQEAEDALATARAEATLGDDLRLQLQSVAEALDVALASDVPASVHLDTLRAAVAQACTEWSTADARFQGVLTDLGAPQSSMERLAQLDRALQQIVQNQAWRAEVDRAIQHNRGLRARLDTFQAGLDALDGVWGPSGAANGSKTEVQARWNGVAQAIAQAEQDQARAAAIVDVLPELRAASEAALSAEAAVHKAETALRDDRLLNGEDDVLQADLATSTASREAISARMIALGGILEEVRQLADRLPDDRDDEHCPLCGHDHDQEARSLQEAIQATLRQDPLAELRLNLSSADAHLRQSQERVSTRARLRAVVDQSRQALTEAQAKRNQLQQEMRAQLPPDASLSLNALQHWVDATTRETAATLLRLQAEQAAVQAQLDRFVMLDHLVEELSPLGLDAESASPLAVRQWLTDTIAQTESARRAGEQTVAQLRADPRAVDQTGLELQQTHAELQVQRQDTVRTITRLQSDWAALSSGGTWPPSAEERAGYAERLDQQKATHIEFQHALDAIADQLTHTSRVREREAEVERQRQAVAAAERVSSARSTWVTDRDKADALLKEARAARIKSRYAPLRRPLWAVFRRAQAHEVIRDLSPDLDSPFVDWTVTLRDDLALQPEQLSRGQRIDLALSIFLARAASRGGTVFMDEPLLHLDDLNRTGFLDTLRALAQTCPNLSVVMTTADRSLVRHMDQKFRSLARQVGSVQEPLLQIVHLKGGPTQHVTAELLQSAEPAHYARPPLLPPETLS